MMSETNTSIPLDQLQQEFNVFDTDRNGYISARDMGHVMASLGHNLSRAELNYLVREIDSDGDARVRCTM